MPVIAGIADWLLDEALRDPDLVTLFESLCVRLNAAGVPLDRTALSWPTLHPIFQAEQVVWTHQTGPTLTQFRHAAPDPESFLASPYRYVHQNRLDFLRRRIAGPEAVTDFPILLDLQAAGFTDYVMTASDFAIARVPHFRGRDIGIMASWATQRPGGFTETDIEALTRLQKPFAVACHAAIQMRVMEGLTRAYLGPTAASRVLSGSARLGDGEMIRAVVWFSDLRGSTWLSTHMRPGEYLQYLRDYYAMTAEAVIAEGGEILDFIGDAVLAIFPLVPEADASDSVRAAMRATETAIARLEARRGTDAPEMQFSIALSMGEVMFGNIGVPSRLSFSAIGTVVNAVTRIDQITKEFGRAVLATEEIVQVEPRLWEPITTRTISDSNRTVTLHGLRDGRDRFDNTALRERLRARVVG